MRGAGDAAAKPPHGSLDFFPTPPWATRALLEHVIFEPTGVAWDPACGDGAMVRPLREYFGEVWASDVHDYGWGHAVDDFLFPGAPERHADWIISNPPFRLAEQFIAVARRKADFGVAMLVRTAFIEGVGRYETLFRPHPPALVAQFTERVPIVKGRLDRTASSATSYAWVVWTRRPTDGTRLVWIPPCRKRLERDDDYPDPIIEGVPTS